MPVNFVEYQGNAGLGLGGNSDIPAISDKPGLNVINDTGRTIMMLNHENNLKKFDQKVKDRDEQLKLLDSGQVQTGEILDKDRPEIKKYQDAANTKFYDFVKKGGVNNPEAYREYQNSVRELKDAVTHAQFRYVGRKQLEKEKADQPLKYKQGLYENHLVNEDKKGFYDGTYSPFQVSTDYDADAITLRGQRGMFDTGMATPQGTATTNKVITKTKDGKTSVTDVQTTVPTKGGKVQQSVDKIVYRDGLPYSVSEQRVDFGKIRQNQIQDFADESGKEYENQMKHREAYETAPDEIFEPTMNHIIDRVSDYNKDLGLQPGQEGYIDPNQLAQKLGIDPLTKKRTGQKIMLSTPDFAAYTALAAHNGSYAPKQMTLLKDEANLMINKQKANTDEFYKKAMAGAANKKANAYARNLQQQMSFRKTEQEQDQFLDEIYNKNLIQQSKLIVPLGGKFGTKSLALTKLPANESLPVFTFEGGKPVQLKPIGATDIKDDNGKIVGYKGGHYEQQYIFGDKAVTPGQINDQYLDFKKTAGANWKGGFDDYLKEAIKNNIYDVKLIGEKGSTDRQVSRAAQRAISNQGTQKGEVGVFSSSNPPSDEPISETTYESSKSVTAEP